MTVAAVANVYSNAFNFNDFLSGGVDPRTGVYTCSLTLGEIKSGGLNGPSLPINLSFNPFNGADTDLGTGWSMALTRYDVASEMLTLSGGERYKARQMATGLVFDELKLETIKVNRPEPGRYDVVHKDGLREELKVYGTSDVAVPMRIVAANGAIIQLDYTSINDRPVLTAVRDAQRTLLSVSRTRGQVTLTQYPGTLCEAQFVLSLANDAVTSIDLPVGGSWYLTYERIGNLNCLTQVDSPLGARELIGYDDAGHRFPPGSPMHSMPYVNSHTVFPRQNQPAITKNYEFSSRNFLGFDDDDIRWSQDGDTLYQSSTDYSYTSTESLMSGARVHSSTVRTYNKYHLLVSEVTTCNKMVTTQLIEYHLDPHKSFSRQSAQFRMPKVQTLRYENRKTKTLREELTHTEFDAMGNLLKQVGPDGVTIQSEFYPASGAEGCPADPLGFIRFEKQRTVIPALGSGAAASTVTRYSYALQPALKGSAVSNVVPVKERFYELTASGETLRSQTDLVYFNTLDDALRHGLLQKQTVTQNGQATRSEFLYVLEGSTLRLQTTRSGFDGTFKTSAQTLSALNGVRLSEESEDEGTVAFEFDAIGRMLSKTISPGTVFAATSRVVYEPASARMPAKMLMTDPMGVQQNVIYDGLGRTVHVEEQDCDNPSEAARDTLRTIYSAQHDALGRLVEETRTDWLNDIALTLKTGFVFDDWGQVKTTLHGDGRKEHREFDPVARRETSWLEGMGKSVTSHNDFGKPDSVEVFNIKGASLGKTLHEYDGLGRAVSQTDPVGNKTSYEYDVFNRLRRSVLPDGHAVETGYAPHSHEQLPIEVKVAGQSIGQQVFDGLGRMIESKVGDRTSSAGYVGGLSQPAWQQTPRGEKIEFVYMHDFGGRLTQRKATGLLATYTYHPVHGQPLSCTEQGRETRFEYYPSGRLKGETSHPGATQTHTYSFGGRPLSCVDVLGNEHKTDYDEWGRPKSFEQNALKADFVYNALGQLTTVTAQPASSERSLITRLAYDDLGREASRSFDVSGSDTHTLTSSYTAAGKLAQKVLKTGDTVLRDELFSYDSRGRLSEYSCSGTQRPRDPYGKEIIKQTYVFDALDNIVSLETEFPGASNLTTYEYSVSDPAQLIGIRHSHADYPQPVSLHYDACGHLIRDDQARTLSYDPLGRLTQIATAVGAVVRGYHYDARDCLVELSQPAGPLTQRFYHDGRVINDVCGDDSSTCLRQAGVLLGQQQLGRGAGVKLFGTDQQQSVLTHVSGVQRSDVVYSPYGYHPAEGGVFGLMGFNGEQLDPLTGLYLLGNGYRAYSPTLMRFLSPDSMSPFGAGGLNPYAYCLGDPINRVDPTGHVSWQSLAGIALSVFSIAASILTFGATTPLAIASLTLAVASGVAGLASSIAQEVAPQSELGNILGYVSLGLGLASFATGLGAAAQGASKAAGAFKSGLSGDPPDAAKAMASGMGGKASKSRGYVKGKGAKKAQQKALRPEVEEGPRTWSFNEPSRLDGFEQLEGVALDRYTQFKTAMTGGVVPPNQVADAMGGFTKFKQMKPFVKSQPDQSALSEIRLNGPLRAIFFINHDDRIIHMVKITHTVKGA
jgi:RHS repeat-associated protein